MTSVLLQEFYPANSYVIREGDQGNKFYIVNGGSAQVTQNKSELMILDKGDYFGEKALYDAGETRRANVIAMPPGTECYTIERS